MLLFKQNTQRTLIIILSFIAIVVNLLIYSTLRSLMVRWVVGSILHGGRIELFLVPVSAPRLV